MADDYHSPDKNPGVKGIQERFGRLGLIANILRSSEGRKRYVWSFLMHSLRSAVHVGYKL